MDGSTLDKEIIPFLRKRDYRLLRELGQGACGKTVLLHDDQIDEYFVCKKYYPYDELHRKELFDKFIREIKLLHQLHHLNVVRVFNYFLYPENYTGYILMEFIDGTEVSTYLSKNPEKVADVFLQTLNGFEHLEQSNILHRDIRPGNLMVTNEGVVKIIDLGFGKLISDTKDFDKSVSLNWWCEVPAEFKSSHYDFTTDVYFIGKLFEKIIRENSISHFPYNDALRKMCIYEPSQRTKSFSLILKEIRNDQFPEIDFTDSEIAAYRNFSYSMHNHISQIDNKATYIDDISRIERNLKNAYGNFMLEESVPDCAVVIRCFIDGIYYYNKSGFSVSTVKKFLDLIRSCTSERSQILLANLHTRLDTIERYDTEYWSSPESDDVPF